ncbi:hypothetical protein ACFVHQ_04190 [Actinomycetes bacterium NPDC127524]
MNETGHFKRSPAEYEDPAGFCLTSILERAEKRKAVIVNFVAMEQGADFRYRMLRSNQPP